MSPQEQFTQIQNTMAAFSPHYRQKMQDVLQAANYQHPDWLLSFFALGVDPEPLTLDLFHSVAPYTNTATQQDYLKQSAKRGFLESVGEDAYRLSDNGRFWIEAFFTATGEALSVLTLPMLPEQQTRLANLLGRVVKGTETAVIPQTKPFFQMSRRTDPGPNAHVLLRIDQYLTDLVRYRDDAHIAAWQSLGVTGNGWEAFTAIWYDGAASTATLAERFSQRTYSAADYTASLAPFVAQGWLKLNAESAYEITAAGRQVREEAEARTNAFYSVGWQALTADEQNKLNILLKNLYAQLQRATAVAIWPVANGALATAAPLYSEKTKALMEQYGINKPGFFFMLWQGLGIEPLPVSATNFARRFPYANPELYKQRLTDMATDGLVTINVAGENEITPAGRAAYYAVDNAFTDVLSKLALLPKEDLQQLTTLLGDIAERSATQDDTTDKWSVGCSRNMHRPDAEALLVKLDEYLDDLNAYRDDTHLAAYASTELSGPAIEAFTLLWKEGLNTAVALQERLEFRGNTVEIYTAALRELVAKGWALETDAIFSLTNTGQETRQTIEAKTDAIFFAAWESLTPTQLNQLADLLTRLHANIQKQVAEKTAVPA